jgi:hypothetical protein
MGKITLITKQHFMKVKKQRKTGVVWAEKGVFFEGVNGKFYKCDTEGPASVRQVVDYQKELKKQKVEQTDLFQQTKLV